MLIRALVQPGIPSGICVPLAEIPTQTGALINAMPPIRIGWVLIGDFSRLSNVSRLSLVEESWDGVRSLYEECQS